MEKYCFTFFIGALFLFAILIIINKPVDKTPISKAYDLQFFTTILGKIHIEEITNHIFEKNGYELVKNELIPVLKKKDSGTCDQIFSEWQKVAKKGLTLDPPKIEPNAFEYLLNGYAGVTYAYFNETPKNDKTNLKIWNQTYIDHMIEASKQSPANINPTYGSDSLAVHAATKHYSIKGQVGAVIGSQTPWVEAYSLVNGAKHVTTVDYQKINITHPQMSFLYVLDLVSQSEKYYNKFDFVVSFSSIEHSGLGRYGDPMDPIGDIREMNKIRCMLKPNGLLFLAFPVGIDSIVFNAHRVYGRIRLAMMIEGFRLLKIFHNETIVHQDEMNQVFNEKADGGQFLFVLEKKSLL